MQKIQSYLYPNRHLLLADLAGFTVENTVVYAKNIKLYQGVDNVIEFDIQNADQKRIDLNSTTDYTPPVSVLQLNIMDESGKAVFEAPYDITPRSDLKGIATAVIPAADLSPIVHQFLKYSVTATDTNDNNIPLYTDSRFSAVGTIEVVRSTVPTTRNAVVYDRFVGEINYIGNVTNHSSVFPAKFYEAVPTQTITVTVNFTNFIGDIWVEGTKDSTISVASFNNATRIAQASYNKTSGSVSFDIDVSDYNWFRVSWQYPDVWAYGSQQNPTLIYGSVDKVTISS